jgi:beta-1,4-glucosyltransferase
MDGYSMWQDEAAVNQEINNAKPDILLVALGNPLQEEWILRHRTSLQIPLIFAIGALLEFLSGSIPRAPQILRRLRLEWAFRLAREPRRLVGRYTIGMLKFFGMAVFGGDKASMQYRSDLTNPALLPVFPLMGRPRERNFYS